ncbi:MAG: hypothetical protein Q9201_003306 [Fulgogasparrea decipioides]
MSHFPDFAHVLILSLLLGTFCYFTYGLYFHPLAKVPGPLLAKFTSIWQIYHSYVGDEHAVIRDLHVKYGKVVRVGPNTVDIADGAALGPIYADKGGFLKTSNYHNFYVDGFPTIFATSDPTYRATRAKLVASLFSNAAIRKGSACINECVERFVQRLQEDRKTSKGRPVELQEHARLLGIDVISSYLFHRTYPGIAEKGSAKSIIPWVNAFVDAGQLFYFPSRLCGSCISIMEKFRPDKKLEGQSAAAVHEYTIGLPFDSNRKDDSFQGRLLQHGISRKEVAAECKDVIFAGVHSFGGVLATTLWYLLKDTAVYTRLREEISQNRDPKVDLQQLQYLQGVVKEGLRLAPANGTRLSRTVPRSGWHFNGHYFPPGTTVGVTAPQLFSNGDVFPDPAAFRPERWLEPSSRMQRDLVPFSLGIRQCIAKNLAMAELFMAVKRVAEADVLRGAKPVQDKIEVLEWFNAAVKGNRIEIMWAEDYEN